MPLQIRRGASGSLPASPAEGEPLYNTTTQELLVGTGSGSVAMAKKAHTHAISDVTNLQTTLDAKVATVNSVAPTSGNITLNLNALSDVVISAATNSQVLQYNGSNWVNQSLATGGTLDGLSDVVISSPQANHVVKWDGSKWVNGSVTWGTATISPSDIYLSSASRLVGSPDDDTTGTSIGLSPQLTISQVSSVDTLDLVLAASSGLEKSSGLKIAAGGVETGMLADSAVTAAKIADSTITLAKLGAEFTAAGKALLDDADAAAQRATLGVSYGVTAGTVSEGNHKHSGTDITTGLVPLARGGTNTDLSATGGSKQFLKQLTAGGAISVGTIGASDLPSHTHAVTDLTTTGTASNTTYLRGDGVWATVSTTGGGTKTYAVFTPLDAQPPASNFATLDTRNSIAVLEFDGGTTDESTTFVGVMPEAASLGSGLKVAITWMADTATSGNVRWGVQFERMNTNLNSDSFDTSAVTEGNSAANGTSGIPSVLELTCTAIDGITAGDAFRVKVYREASDTTNDTMSGDAQLISVEVRSAA